jgi:hypothetical protein
MIEDRIGKSALIDGHISEGIPDGPRPVEAKEPFRNNRDLKEENVP